MSDDSTTQCLLFPGSFCKPVVAKFDQREGSSDGGALLLKAADRRYGLVDGLAACLRDERQAGKVDHSLRELLAQRVFSIACGYPDANDSARLSEDPIHKLLLDRDPIEGRDLASQSTLSRFENGVGVKELYRSGEFLAESVIRRHARRLRHRPDRVTIDLDPTDDPTHGAQQLSFFNGHYDTWCYLPMMGFVSFNDEAGKWPGLRRVIIKAEVVRAVDKDPKDNPRFVITNMKQSPQWIYEHVYCQRGDVENRIKELHDLEIDRTSCTSFWANQFRVLLTAAAYVLMQELRLRAAGTACARAQVAMLRERLLKLGARVLVSVRRVVVHLPASFPFLQRFVVWPWRSAPQ